VDEGSERLEGPLVCLRRGGGAATWASSNKKKGGTSASCVFGCVWEGDGCERYERMVIALCACRRWEGVDAMASLDLDVCCLGCPIRAHARTHLAREYE